MTTVINMNILNLFGLTFNDDTSINSQVPDKRHNLFSKRGGIIDVTHYSRVVDDNESADEKDTRFSINNHRKANFVVRPPEINKTYDRRGKIIQCFQPKGVYVDSYV
jgi:hypothetical protein